MASISLLFFRLTTGHNWEDDFALYLLQAQGLVDGKLDSVLAANAYTVKNSSFPFGPLAYPWGTSLLLTPLYFAFGLNFLALKLLGVIAMLGLLLTLYFGYKNRHQPAWLLVLVGLFSFNHWLLSAVDNILSDIPFLFFSTLTVIIIDRVMAKNQVFTFILLDRILVGLLVGSCYLIRSNGVLLVPLIALAQLISFRKQPFQLTKYVQANYLAILLPYLSLTLLIFIVTYLLPDGGLSHVAHLSISSPALMLDNFLYNLALPAEFFGHRAIYFVTGFFFVIGIIKFGISRQIEVAYMILTLAIYIVWPYQQGLRFLLPLLPFYISFAISGVEVFLTSIQQITWCKRIARPVALAAALSFIVAQFLYATVIDQRNLNVKRVIPDGVGTPAATELFSFIRASRLPEDIIVFRKPRAMHLMTGVPSIMLSDAPVIAKILPVLLVLDSKNTDYQIDDSALAELRTRHPTQRLFSNDQFSVYRIHN